MGEIKDREACTADFALQRNLVTLNVTLIFFYSATRKPARTFLMQELVT